MTGSVPRLNTGVRQKHDKVRGINVLLGPERSLMLDDIGQAIMSEVDGTRNTGEIAQILAAKFNAPADVIEADVVEFLNSHAANRYVEWIGGKSDE